MGVFSKNKQSLYTPSQATVLINREQETGKSSRLGRTMLLKGELHAKEEVLIEGALEGTIKSDGIVIVGKSGRVLADINAREVIIKGEVTGNVTGLEKVEIVPHGVLNGNIVSQRVVLAEGAIFKGNIDMTVKESSKKGSVDNKIYIDKSKPEVKSSEKK